MATTLYWHDYETFGVDPRRDRPAQFAGLRTDEDLNELGEPLLIYCRPAADTLPHPEACLLTGITPQRAAEKGLPEPEFCARIHAELSRPGTCGVGYNTLRFDDEVTRYLLYRNFYDPYAREWQQGNSRWDLIDLVRMSYALRPEGLEWPTHADGRPSFRLEDLTAANGIAHEGAHDALADVRATIALARLLKARQPRLYDWLYQLRDKRRAMDLLDLRGHTPVLHTSRMYPAEQGCTTLVMPLLADTRNKNAFLVYDLRQDPAPFLALDAEALAERLFTRAEDLAEDSPRLPVKTVQINKCPALAPLSTLDEAAAARIGLDPAACEAHRQVLLRHQDFMQRVLEAHGGHAFAPATDPELALYDGFIRDDDRALMARVHELPPQQLDDSHLPFRDPRLPELLFRYRARNWPESLDAEQAGRWRAWCRQRLDDPAAGASITLAEYQARLRELYETRGADPDVAVILEALKDWGRTAQAQGG